MRFSNTIDIKRPPEEVFDYLAAPENIPEWNYAISESERSPSGPIGIGTRIRQRRTLPRPAEEQLEVTELQPDRRLVLAGDVGPLHGTVSYELEPTSDGTQLTNDVELDASGPLRLAAPLFTGRVRAAVADNLATLKRTLESGNA
ncbi:MAG: SRPBCC family protein [Candidatus Limnocylindrales bacterium]